MDRYLIALYLHFLAVVAAVAASSVLHFNFVRLRRADRVSEARDAAAALARVAPLMPLFSLALLATGAYLVHLRWPWSQGWVIASIVGLISMPIVAVVVHKPRLSDVGRRLATAKGPDIDPDLRAAIRDPLVWSATYYNHVMALTIMFIMVTKPGLAIALAVLLVAPIAAVWSALSAGRASAGTSAAVTD